MVLVPSVGFAQTLTDSERSARVALLSRADAARRANRLDEALELIRQAEQIGPTAGTRMLSAQVLSQMGRYTSALVAAEQCVREAELDTQTTSANRRAIRETCERQRDEANQHVARLTVRVPGGAPQGMEVRVNDAVLRPPLYNVEQVFDAGQVTVRAAIPGRAPWERTQVLTAGQSVTVDVEVPAASVPVVSPPVRPVEREVRHDVEAPPPPDDRGGQQDAPSTSGSTQRTLAWVSGALGVALTGGAVVSGLMFLSRRDQYNQTGCVEQPRTDACTAQYNQAIADLEPLNTLQYAGYIAGGALLATSVILFVTAPSGARAPAVSLGVTPGGLSLGYGARF